MPGDHRATAIVPCDDLDASAAFYARLGFAVESDYGNYRILAPLGQGGMARVYRARQENLDREVAVKVLPPWFAADRSWPKAPGRQRAWPSNNWLAASST